MTVELPEDIILEILYRLPARPLKRFSCVSKRWESLISEPEFGKTHYELASKCQTLTHRLLVLEHYYSHDYYSHEITSFDLETPSSGKNKPPVRRDNVPFTKKDGRFCPMHIVGSCKGLVACIIPLRSIPLGTNSMYSYIWNPLTRFFKKLPDPEISWVNGFQGFGYVSATEDYKILVSNSRLLKCDTDMDIEALIFSSKAGVWRKIESPLMFHPEKLDQGVLVNETLHWIFDYYEVHKRLCIVTFDLAKEEFRKMMLPNNNIFQANHIEVCCGGGGGGGGSGSLYVHAMRYQHHSSGLKVFKVVESVECWVMREYGATDSWAKLYTLKLGDNIIVEPIYLVLGTSSTVVMVHEDMVDHWWVNRNQLNVFRIDHKGDKHDLCSIRWGEEMIVYEESLLSLCD